LIIKEIDKAKGNNLVASMHSYIHSWIHTCIHTYDMTGWSGGGYPAVSSSAIVVSGGYFMVLSGVECVGMMVFRYKGGWASQHLDHYGL
jgi:hypothetical protein